MLAWVDIVGTRLSRFTHAVPRWSFFPSLSAILPAFRAGLHCSQTAWMHVVLLASIYNYVGKLLARMAADKA